MKQVKFCGAEGSGVCARADEKSQVRQGASVYEFVGGGGDFEINAALYWEPVQAM